jgi:outer membrane protein OmpA-like peptidoglycan-associated protein
MLTPLLLLIVALHGLLAIGTASAQPRTEESSQSPIELQIQALPSQYPLGYPVAVRLIARNTSDAALPIKGRLSPSYGLVRIAHRRVDAMEWSVLEPLARFEPIADEQALLQPGEQTDQTVPIYFGDDAWTFPEPGEYMVHARLQPGGDAQDTVSTPIRIRIGQPLDTDDKAAVRPLIDDQGRLDEVIGRALAFGGRSGSEQAWETLEQTVDRYGHTALGSALKLAIVTQRLRPPIDPQTGERALPDLAQARELLAEICTDSGVAALKWQLLQRHAGSVPESLTNRAETAATAWDGTTSLRGDTMPTYSDPSLQAWGPSLHFCFNEAHLRDQVHRGIPALVLQLRREKPLRIVLVGHGDAEGTCRNNDRLALRRAQAVRRALQEAGMHAQIEVASLGERRPLDFASTSGARDLNRRVEILIQSSDEAFHSASPRLAPDCPPAPRPEAVSGSSQG